MAAKLGARVIPWPAGPTITGNFVFYTAMFKTIRLYIKIRHDFVEITNLETGETVSQRVAIPFSGTRNVVGNFSHTQQAIEAVIRESGVKTSFWTSLQVLIQQLDGAEGGLSDIEKRALRDLGEMVGARKVYLVEEERPLSASEALLHFG